MATTLATTATATSGPALIERNSTGGKNKCKKDDERERDDCHKED
jgi:hypothetical protein